MGYWMKGVGVIHTGDSQTVAGKTHHIWIEDESGSMGWAVSELADDMISHLQELSQDDIISVGYFSGVGDFRWFVIGASLNDKARIAKLIRDNARSRNTTCFSEILADLDKVIDGSKSMADMVNLAFLTDGHPVVPSYEVERKAIFKAIEQVKSKLSQVLIVGYGDYYNRQLLSEMAMAFGATLQHADKIEKFGKELKAITISRSRKRVTVKLPDGVSVAFTVGKNGAVSLYQIENGQIVAPQGESVYVFSSGANVTHDDNDDALGAAYATALALNKNGKTDEALKALSDIGDVGLVNVLANSLTNAEIGLAEEKIQKAIVDGSARFASGKKVGCLPKEDAFDLLDLLNLLQKDKDAKFYPYHESWNYKRIGRKTVTKGDYPKFKPDENQGVPFGDLVWSSDELNLSVRAVINGSVTFKDPQKAKSLGFAETFPTVVFRNYALVANCYPNVTVLPVTIGKETHDKLVEVGLLSGNFGYMHDVRYLLPISQLPVCNRSKSKAGYSASEIGKLAVESTLIAGHLNGLNSVRKELDPKKEVLKKTSYTPEQEEFLNENGIFDGKYDPPSEQAEATDVLNVRVFDVAVKSFSSFPKLEQVKAMAVKGKFTPSGEAAFAGVKDFELNAPQNGLSTKLQWIDARAADLKSQRNELQGKINTARFAMALGNRWFTDLPSRQDKQVGVSVEGKDYTVEFKVEEKQKKI